MINWDIFSQCIHIDMEVAHGPRFGTLKETKPSESLKKLEVIRKERDPDVVAALEPTYSNLLLVHWNRDGSTALVHPFELRYFKGGQWQTFEQVAGLK